MNETAQSTIALAMAGGSFRAASSCGGILRALHQKTIVDSSGNTVPAMTAVKYNSGISGGSIPAVLYSYAQVPTEDLLETNRSTDPADITLDELKRMPRTSYGYTLIEKPNFFLRLLKTITNPVKIIFYIINSVKIHSWWSGFMYTKLCEPMNIPRNKYFTSSKEEMQRLINSSRSSGSRKYKNIKEEDFLLPRDDVKTLPLILWSVHGRRADVGRFTTNFKNLKSAAWEEFLSEQTLSFFSEQIDVRGNMTDILLEKRDEFEGNIPIPYLGTPDEVFSPYDGDVHFGGRRNKAIHFPSNLVKPFEWGTRTKFSIETLIALSTNFLGTNGLQEGVESTAMAQLASNVRQIKFNDDTWETLLVADGGTNDLMGILPALQQKVDKIIAIYNFNQNPPYADFQTTYGEIYEKAPSTSLNDPNFNADFREWLKYINPRITCYFGYYGTTSIPQSILTNHVFHDPKLDHLKKLMIKFNSLYEAGEPLVVTMEDLETIDNPFWGIEGGNIVDITLVWFNLPRKFSERVPEDLGLGLDKNGLFTNEDMNLVHFPELPNGMKDSLGYTAEQINLMAYLGSWIIHQAWDGLQGHDGKEKFKGFKKIFESADLQF